MNGAEELQEGEGIGGTDSSDDPDSMLVGGSRAGNGESQARRAIQEQGPVLSFLNMLIIGSSWISLHYF